MEIGGASAGGGNVEANLEQYTIERLVNWYRAGDLVLDPEFQRGEVWSSAAKVFLIDTILRGLPLPSLLFRPIVDVKTMSSVTEVVDGQQRLRAILEFADNKLRLTPRAGEFAGLTYADLDEGLQRDFLGYRVGVYSLLNASDEAVLEMFSRMNSYTVTLTPPELRHAKYGGPFKWAVNELAASNIPQWERWGTFTKRRLVRLYHHSLVAEALGLVMTGIADGGESNIDKLYENLDKGAQEAASDDLREAVARVAEAMNLLSSDYDEVLTGSRLASPPHLLLLIVALVHAMYGVPAGRLDASMPAGPAPLLDTQCVLRNLSVLNSVMEEPESAPQQLVDFAKSVDEGATTRMSSRGPRFAAFYRALTDDSLLSDLDLI
jgi:hypothetical protein